MPTLDPGAELEQAREELERKTEAHQAWGIGGFRSWNIDQDSGLLVLSDPGGKSAKMSAQIIGTFDTNDESWFWGWANSSLNPKLAIASKRAAEFCSEHGLAIDLTPTFKSTMTGAWDITALATRVTKSEGAYRGLAGQLAVFMTFSDVKISTR